MFECKENQGKTTHVGGPLQLAEARTPARCHLTFRSLSCSLSTLRGRRVKHKADTSVRAAQLNKQTLFAADHRSVGNPPTSLAQETTSLFPDEWHQLGTETISYPLILACTGWNPPGQAAQGLHSPSGNTTNRTGDPEVPGL